MYCFIHKVLNGTRKLCKTFIIYATARSSENRESSRKMGVLGHYDSFWTGFEKNINFLQKIKIKNLSFSSDKKLKSG